MNQLNYRLFLRLAAVLWSSCWRVNCIYGVLASTHMTPWLKMHKISQKSMELPKSKTPKFSSGCVPI